MSTREIRARNEVRLGESVNADAPVTVSVAIFGDGGDSQLASVTIDRPWASMHQAMTRADLIRVRDAIDATLAATDPDPEALASVSTPVGPSGQQASIRPNDFTGRWVRGVQIGLPQRREVTP